MKKTKKEVVVKKTAIKKSIFNKNKRKRNVTKKSSNGMNISHNGLMALISTYLDKAEYFTKPNRELARIIKSEHPELTQNIEAIRTNIRILKGCCGKTNIAYNYAGGKYYVDKNDYNKSVHFPISDSKERTPFYLPLGVKIGCMFDIHVPFHDNRAVDACINHLLKSNVKVVLLQEVFDFYFQSKFDKDIRKPAFVDQMEKYIDFMYELKDAFPKGTKFYYQESNHDERWNHWLGMGKCQELLQHPYFGVENVFEYNKLGITYLKDKTLVKAGKLNIIHGHEFKGGGGVNPARWLALRTKASTACGHFHKTSESPISNQLEHELSMCYSIGCLSELSPDFAVYNEWNHGFGIIETDSSGNFFFENKKIFKGKVF